MSENAERKTELTPDKIEIDIKETVLSDDDSASTQPTETEQVSLVIKPGTELDAVDDDSETTPVVKSDLSQQDRDKILDTSLHLFAKQGVHQTSLVDIAAKSELSKTSIYKHFQNKEAIADALFDDLTARLDQTLIDIHKNSTTSIACLRSIVEFLLDLTQQAPDVAQLLFCPKDQGLQQNKSDNDLFPGLSQMVIILESGMNSGELEKIDPHLAYASFMGLISNVISLHLEGLLPDSLDHYLPEVWYPLWRALSKNPNRPAT
ncbi:MAG: TetR/AcrR family transcriptional regulator [Gammaproteobacteria bacterium]|nr:TetR/AcrR family transcriptional regulator [Gammaproteobacteria bacterium]